MKDKPKRRPDILSPVMEERILAVAYGDASLWDKLIVFQVSRRSVKVQKALDQARETARLTRTRIAEVRCPDTVSTYLERYREPEAPLMFPGNWIRVFTGTVGVMAAATIAVMFNVFVEPADDNLTQEQIELATLEAKQSLALIQQLMQDVAGDASKQAIVDYTAKPLNETLDEYF